jgi:hypothetical protein
MVAKRDRRASEMLPSRHSLWRVRIRYALGFAAARRALMSAELGRGKSNILRVALIWAHLRVRQNSPHADASPLGLSRAMAGITIQCDGRAKLNFVSQSFVAVLAVRDSLQLNSALDSAHGFERLGSFRTPLRHLARCPHSS